MSWKVWDMQSEKKKLSEFIEPYDELNTSGEFSSLDFLQGINSNKYFQECKSNKNDINLLRYRICRNNTFSYNKATSRNGEKISIAYRTDGDCLVSPSYQCFRIKDINVLDPYYLMLNFRKKRFDQYARFNSWGSATEFFTWDCMENAEIRMPNIDVQLQIVKQYNSFKNRIENLKKQNESLRELALTLFKEIIQPLYDDDSIKKEPLESICDIKGGKRLPKGRELLDEVTRHPYVRVRDIDDYPCVCLNENYQYIDEDTHQEIKRYVVSKGDVIISIVGTVGLLGIIDESLDGANLTENCMKLCNIKKVSPYYLFWSLLSMKANSEFDELIVGAVQQKFPMYNIKSIKIAIPSIELMEHFNKWIVPITDTIVSNTKMMTELQRAEKMFIESI